MKYIESISLLFMVVLRVGVMKQASAYTVVCPRTKLVVYCALLLCSQSRASNSLLPPSLCAKGDWIVWDLIVWISYR